MLLALENSVETAYNLIVNISKNALVRSSDEFPVLSNLANVLNSRGKALYLRSTMVV